MTSSATGRRRGRPNKHDEIVHKAAKIFYVRGTSVGVDSLVDEIGVAKMTLYKHFRTKDELIVACLHHIDQRFRTWLEGQSESLSPEMRILGIFNSLRSWFESDSFRGCAFVNATVELANPEHPAREAVLEHKHRTRAWIAALAADCGIAEPDVVARAVVQLMEGAISTALVEDDPGAADVAREIASVVLLTARRNGPSAGGPTVGIEAASTPMNGASGNWL
ncbi:TetR/AcrR family transcriptional regulator [Nocardia vinacea]|uniref:TetR/AcrR family transcriptional regulator n=1 Tax=Nocardia vinacea TaxID=96468 RepID=A0ABZ1YNG0_9NOCA|nr:TetR/AcrR family transcriptional regulator [Nocardia vinacea]